MKKVILSAFALAIVTIFTSCEKEDSIVVEKDYGLKTFEADMEYVSGAAHGTVSYTQQSYFKFGETDAVAVGNYGEDSWTDLNVYTESENYNITTPVSDWDIIFTYYTTPINMGEIVEYGVTGALINTTGMVEVALFDYSDSDTSTDISEAFASLSLTDVTALEYSTTIDFIGYGWKSVDMTTGIYTVDSSLFYIVKLASGDSYKMRFTGFHGDSSDERIVQIEYQLMD